ncbi:MAG: hypothetical protein HC896_05570 [Bacteroidales bacterium]|nr:hypothetical protein [Bacteroidales bacterium]
MDIKEIKSRLPILTVLSNYGIKPDRNNHIRCPFHDDETPSMKIYPETGTYHCFGCGKTGDQIQWIQDKEGCSQHEAILKAQSWIPGTAETEPQQPTIKNTTIEKALGRTLPPVPKHHRAQRQSQKILHQPGAGLQKVKNRLQRRQAVQQTKTLHYLPPKRQRRQYLQPLRAQDYRKRGL